MKNAPITVVVTTYNDSEYLVKAINSIVSQILLPTQLIIVDDGSRNNDACEITSKYINNENGIEVSYYKKNNGGASSARNFGLKHASQKFITFLDADDEMLPNNLQDKFDAIEKLSTDYFGVYGSAKKTNNEKDVYANVDELVPTSSVGKPLVGIPGGSCYYLFRTKYVNEINGFDEKLPNNEDYDLLIRLIKINKKCKGSIGCGILITVRINSLSRGGDSKKIFNNVMMFLNKAEKNNFFDINELNSRKKSAYLVFIRTIVFKNPVEALDYASIAFSYGAPEGLKQNLVYFLSKFRNTKSNKM